MQIKKGVRVTGLSPEIVIAIIVVNDVYRKYGRDCTITSGTEGKHGYSSEHYKGDAVDFRTRDLFPDQKTAIAKEIAARLGDNYDVVLEETHLHVEFDPK